MTIAEPPQTSLQPYVEDAADNDDDTVAIVDAPPHAPSPPRPAVAVPAQPVNVFDFLVNDETPNASKVALSEPKAQMCMVADAPPLFKSATASPEIPNDADSFQDFDADVDDDDYSYVEVPVPTREYEEYRTPAPKAITYKIPQETTSTDKKRKRQVEELDLTQARRPSQELDEEMYDADPSEHPVLHSGLTGGLNRLLASSKFPPSPEYSAGSGPDPSPLSPVKRKRISAIGNGVTIEKVRGRKGNTAGQLVKVRKVRRSSDESRPRKHHRSHKHRDHDEHDEHERPKRAMKAIEYHRTESPDANNGNQLIVYRNHAEMFMSFVNKGPESESGCSMNKALKRYHRERGNHGLGKQEAEKDLWKSLRLKRNDRGEIVLLLGSKMN